MNSRLQGYSNSDVFPLVSLSETSCSSSSSLNLAMRQPKKRDKPRKFPPGFRFSPTDEELIVGYLRRKLHNQPLPYDFIQEVDVYKFTPQQLVDKHKIWGQDGCWYFFTPRERKYPKGNRPSRTIEIEGSEGESGFKGGWKATSSDKTIIDSRIKIDQRHGVDKSVPLGKKKTLVYYEAKDKKTDWIMYEYLDSSQEFHKRDGTMKLDAVVLCSIHKKHTKKDSKEIVAVPETQVELQRSDSFANDLQVEAVNIESSPSSDALKYLLEYPGPSMHQLTITASATDHQNQQVKDPSLLTCSEPGNQAAAAAESENGQNASIASNRQGDYNLQFGQEDDDFPSDQGELVWNFLNAINWTALEELGNDQDPPAEGP